MHPVGMIDARTQVEHLVTDQLVAHIATRAVTRPYAASRCWQRRWPNPAVDGAHNARGEPATIADRPPVTLPDRRPVPPGDLTAKAKALAEVVMLAADHALLALLH
jgi:hypothetical protein